MDCNPKMQKKGPGYQTYKNTTTVNVKEMITFV